MLDVVEDFKNDVQNYTNDEFHYEEPNQELIEQSINEKSSFLLKVIPSSAEYTVLLQNALVLIENAEYSLAHNLLGKILSVNPKNPQAIYRLADSYFQQKVFYKAAKCFSELVKVEKNGESLFLLADALYLAGSDLSSLKNYKEALNYNIADERAFTAYKNIGNIYIKKGDIDNAERNYQQAYKMNAESDVLAVNLGTLHIQRNLLDKALVEFRRAVHINGGNDKAWIGLALIHRRLGDFALAWANLERALDVNNMNKTALELSVEWGASDNCLSDTVSYLIHYMECNFDDFEISLLLSKTLYCLGRVRDARREIERTLLLEPKNEKAYDFLLTLERDIANNKIKNERST